MSPYLPVPPPESWEHDPERLRDLLRERGLSGAEAGARESRIQRRARCLAFWPLGLPSRHRQGHDMDIYEEHGYASRKAYLRGLAEEYGIEAQAVFLAASVLGPDEDFDGLVTAIQDGDLNV